MERVGRKCTIEDMIEGDRYLTFLLISQKKKHLPNTVLEYFQEIWKDQGGVLGDEKKSMGRRYGFF